jgi:hypothetical protein
MDLYQILQVNSGASSDGLRQSFLRLARMYRPDVSTLPDAELKFKQVNYAYRILSDPLQRITYDHQRNVKTPRSGNRRYKDKAGVWTGRVWVHIEEVMMENDWGREIEGVVATCIKCGHCTESFGGSGASVRRCLALLNEECPLNENNWYLEANREND